MDITSINFRMWPSENISIRQYHTPRLLFTKLKQITICMVCLCMFVSIRQIKNKQNSFTRLPLQCIISLVSYACGQRDTERMCKMDCASYVFPAVRGTQAQREYYISMVPLDVMSKIFQFADEDLPPEIRAQRILNKSRIPEIRDYILSNPDTGL